MKDAAKILKTLSDPTRMRILMILAERELCVCQIMGILGVSQPLISRNLHLLLDVGFLEERKEGKLVFYSIGRKLPPLHGRLIAALKEFLKDDTMLLEDLRSLKDCEEFQKKTGRCDMKTLTEFMSRRRKRAESLKRRGA